MLEPIPIQDLVAVAGGVCEWIDDRWMPNGKLFKAIPFKTFGFVTRAACRFAYKQAYGL